MLTGAHVILYSANAGADRALLRDVLNLTHVDAGHGWLIFALPSAEVAVHPADAGGRHELFLMCADVNEFVASMSGHRVSCSAVHEERWGLMTYLTLPGGGRLGVYEARLPRPNAAPAARGPTRKTRAPPKRTGGKQPKPATRKRKTRTA